MFEDRQTVPSEFRSGTSLLNVEGDAPERRSTSIPNGCWKTRDGKNQGAHIRDGNIFFGGSLLVGS